MRRLISFLLVIILSLGLSLTVFASAPDFSTPKEFPTGIFIQPSQVSKFAPTPSPKGVDFYPEFANVPDYAAFAGLKAKDVIFYDTTYSDFFYLDNSRQLFSYSSKVYDYFNVNMSRLGEYLIFLTRIGFKQSENLALLVSPDNLVENPEDYTEYMENPRYIDLIKEDILYDPGFELDLDGVYTIETEYGYTVMAFGESRNYAGGLESEHCMELRLYNLYFDVDVMGNIMKYADSHLENMDARTFYLYVPERQAYIPVAQEEFANYSAVSGSGNYSAGTANESIDDYVDRLIRYLGGSQ